MRAKKEPLTTKALLIRFLIAGLVVYASFQAIRIAAVASLMPKVMACMEAQGQPPPPPLSEAQQRAIATGMIDCIDARTNFLERLFFDRDAAVASIRIEGSRKD